MDAAPQLARRVEALHLARLEAVLIGIAAAALPVFVGGKPGPVDSAL